MTREYEFAERMKMSSGRAKNASVESVLLSIVPGATTVHRAGETNDRAGTDWWVEVAGRHLSVDAKVRSKDFGKDDLALETYSVKGYKLRNGRRTSSPMQIGWTRDERKRSDYVLWIWPGRYCLLPFLFLCKAFQENWQEWCQAYQTVEQFTPAANGDRLGWFSECVFVPRAVVWEAIGNRFAPAPPVTETIATKVDHESALAKALAET